jgi:E3 ubiquitin-protein ligase HUWE1
MLLLHLAEPSTAIPASGPSTNFLDATNKNKDDDPQSDSSWRDAVLALVKSKDVGPHPMILVARDPIVTELLSSLSSVLEETTTSAVSDASASGTIIPESSIKSESALDGLNVSSALLSLFEAIFIIASYTLDAEPENKNILLASSSGPDQESLPESQPPSAQPSSEALNALHPSSDALHSASDPHPVSLQQKIMWTSFVERHRLTLNGLIRAAPGLLATSFSVLVRHCAKLVDFDNKRAYFRQQLAKDVGPRVSPVLHITIRRAHVFEDSFHQLAGRSGPEIAHGKLHVRFHGEDGVDAGGVTRDWFGALARQMFNPDYALFRTSALDKTTYQPNRASYVNPAHLAYFTFVGRIIGKALRDGRLLDCYFTRAVYKHILGIPIDYRDMEAVDPTFYASLSWILTHDITDVLDLVFATDVDDFGVRRTVDLKPDGRHIPVTQRNKVEYVRLVTEQRLTKAIQPQLDALLTGFYDMIPRSLLAPFNEHELELLISGLPEIDLDDWRNNTEYHGGYTPASPQILWFWRAVRTFDQESRAKLLQFVTGTSKVPLEGFAALQGATGIQKFQIHKDFSPPETRLPSAHTCFNQLDLPAYPSYETLRTSLLIAINEGAIGFGLA